MKKNQGITLLALIITIIIMLILAGVTISIVGGSDGIIAKAEQAVSKTDVASQKEDIELSIAAIKMDYYENYAANRARFANAKEFIVAELQEEYTTSRGAIMVANAAGEVTYTYKGVATAVTIDENGSVTLGESSGADNEANIIGKTYYGDASVRPTDQKYFTFTVNEDGKTATITGIKEEYAEKYYYENWPYSAAILDNGKYITDIVIPYEIIDEDGNKYVVDTIGNDAFYLNIYENYNKDLEVEAKAYFTSFVLPNTIVNIGNCAFLGCKELNTIILQDGVINIGGGAFRCCPKLKTLNIPNTVTSIDSMAFAHSTSLKYINIPQSVVTMGYNMFWNWYSNQIVNIEASSAPAGWDSRWNDNSDATINWGVSM